MGTTHKHEGHTMHWLNATAAAVKSNEIVAFDDFVGIAETDIAIGEVGALSCIGVHAVPSGGAVFAQGDRVDLDSGTAVAGAKRNVVFKASAATDAVVEVAINV